MKILLEQGSDVDLQTKVLLFSFLLFDFSLFYLLWLNSWLCSCCVIFCSVLFFLSVLFVKDGMTPLHKAADNSFEGIAKILIEHGSNVDLQDNVFDFLFF